MYLKKFMVWSLIWLGTGLDHLPALYKSSSVHRGHIYWGQYGCSSGFCSWAGQLDERYGTNIYKPVS